MTTTLANVNLQANVSLDDIVNIFVSRFETEAHNRFGAIQANIKETQAKIKALVDQVSVKFADELGISKDPVPVNSYVAIQGKISNVQIDWVRRLVNVHIDQTVVATQSNNVINYTGASTVVQFKLPEDFFDAHQRLDAELNIHRTDLSQVNSELGSIDRRVRALKGQIAERKLQEAGMEELLTDPGLLKLVQL